MTAIAVFFYALISFESTTHEVKVRLPAYNEQSELSAIAVRGSAAKAREVTERSGVTLATRASSYSPWGHTIWSEKIFRTLMAINVDNPTLTTIGALTSAALLFFQNRLISRQTKIIENQWKKQQPHNDISFRFSTRFWFSGKDEEITLEVENTGNSRIKIGRAEIIMKKSDEVITTMDFNDIVVNAREIITSEFNTKKLPKAAPLLLKIYFFSSLDNFRFQNTRTFDEDLSAM